MTADAILDALVERIADAVVVRLAAPASPTHYTRAHLPPGVRSWRAARELAARHGITTSRPGRDTLIDAASWDRWASTRHTTRISTPIEIADSDRRALAALGIASRGAR